MSAAELSPKEALFVRIAKHLLKQGQKSEGGNQCLYRGPEERSCAVGCVISDEHYSTGLEGNSLSRLDSKGAKQVLLAVEASLCRKLYPDEVELLSALQRVHDTRPSFDWLRELSFVASKFAIGATAQREAGLIP